MTVSKQIKKIAKRLLAFLPIALTRNERYDRLSKKIIQKTCVRDSVCIDIGAHEGKILDWLIAQSPLAKHYAFEPIPELFCGLVDRYNNNTHLFQVALTDTKGRSSFNLVHSNRALSGIKKRSYHKMETDSTIEVETNCLDHLIPIKEKIRFIKMDVEGAELLVIKGSMKTIQASKPIILFECGKVGSVAYGFSSKDAFHLFEKELDYQIYLLNDWLKGRKPLSFQDFYHYFENGKEFFFMAVPNPITKDHPLS